MADRDRAHHARRVRRVLGAPRLGQGRSRGSTFRTTARTSTPGRWQSPVWRAPDRGVRRVEVQVDEEGWQEAEMSAAISDATWVQFDFRWDATPGEHLLRVRATDGRRGADRHADAATTRRRAWAPHDPGLGRLGPLRRRGWPPVRPPVRGAPRRAQGLLERRRHQRPRRLRQVGDPLVGRADAGARVDDWQADAAVAADEHDGRRPGRSPHRARPAARRSAAPPSDALAVVRREAGRRPSTAAMPSTGAGSAAASASPPAPRLAEGSPANAYQ